MRSCMWERDETQPQPAERVEVVEFHPACGFSIEDFVRTDLFLMHTRATNTYTPTHTRAFIHVLLLLRDADAPATGKDDATMESFCGAELYVLFFRSFRFCIEKSIKKSET